MARRLVVFSLLSFCVVASPALGGDNLGQQKQSLDAKLAAVQARVASTRARESALDTQIGNLDAQIGKLETQVGDVSTKLSALHLRLRQRRLDALDKLFSIQTVRLGDLRREYSLAVTRLDDRLVSIYKQPDPGTIQLRLDVVLDGRRQRFSHA
jgi:septal ring factor EnvC (AmiA/AmiB activator)